MYRKQQIDELEQGRGNQWVLRLEVDERVTILSSKLTNSSNFQEVIEVNLLFIVN